MMQSYETDPWLPEGLASVIATADPIPVDVLMALKSTLARRATGADVAELVYDSVVDQSARVRGDSTARQLSFQGPRLTVEMEVVPERDRVVGQLVPPVPAHVEVRHTCGSDVVEVDDFGRFVLQGVPKGPVSLRCRATDGGDPVATITDWVVL